MITAYGEISMVIDSMKSGAYDFIFKPINPDILELNIEKALSSIALVKEVQVLQEKYLRENEPCFIGASKKIDDIMDFINMVAKSPDTPIMILGETGTGKELMARAIHARSPVFRGPFVAVNCSAFPEELIESELFGYEPGAFSGARPQGKKGFLQEADKGTLFLDEVADLSPAARPNCSGSWKTGSSTGWEAPESRWSTPGLSLPPIKILRNWWRMKRLEKIFTSAFAWSRPRSRP